MMTFFIAIIFALFLWFSFSVGLINYALRCFGKPKNPDDGEPWVSEEYKDLKCIISDIAQENHIAWELYNESDGIDIYIWLDGDFDNRKKFAVSPYYRLLFSVTELE
ncbi:hypothetical protein [Aggregatibacter actinomycetemcomitans]|uniref:hypothetical protein n=1 Tax=Aggregatibacter actinomycetemcomitans TaxID=714 RepID=UPI00138E400B|nr:hypothetical protein [Aggregatibacter actinomycetemcomitans]